MCDPYPISAWAWLGVKTLSLQAHPTSPLLAPGACPCWLGCEALTRQSELHPGHTSKVICYKCCVEIDNKGKRNRGFQLPKLAGQQRVRHSLIIFISSQA